jgi:hypothetical protein
VDPEETLRLIREKVAEALAESGSKRDDLVDELAELFDGLDTWIVGGGFLPPSWGRWWQRAVTPPAVRLRTEVERSGDPTAVRIEDVYLPSFGRER